MATTAYHNQFIRDLDNKWTILFLYQRFPNFFWSRTICGP